MKVVEIFNSIEGEGKRAGLPATFIRLFGCNLRCSYCDSMYAVEGSNYKEMSISEILEVLDNFDCPNVTVTGGEPLIHKDIVEFLKILCDKGYWVNVETNGSISLPYRDLDNRLFYTVDYKTTSSGMKNSMLKEILLTENDVLKFVVGTQQDLNEALLWYNELNYKPEIYVSPVFGNIEPKQLVEFILKNKLWNWKVQLQLHKFIWNPNMRGV